MNNQEIFEDTVTTPESGFVESEKPTIKHLVISSGVVYGLSFYGALKELAINNVWNIDNIETIFATSAGTMIAVFIALKYDWESMDNYIINRPWKHVFKLNINTIMNAFQSSGIFDKRCFEEMFTPLFKGRDIEIDINMRDFKEFTGIDFHFIATRLDTFETFDINAESCPEWTVVEAVCASCSAPLLFQPLIKDGIQYADGAFLAKYPLAQSLKYLRVLSETVMDENEILGIYLDNYPTVNIIQSDESKESANDDSIIFSPLFHYMYSLCSKMVCKLMDSKTRIRNQICIVPKEFRLNDFYLTMESKEKREWLIQLGIDHAKSFMGGSL